MPFRVYTAFMYCSVLNVMVQDHHEFPSCHTLFCLCSGCEALTALPSLPTSLKYLYCSMCTSLLRLPDLSGTCMQVLHLDGCKELAIDIQQLRTLPPTLPTLNAKGLEHAFIRLLRSNRQRQPGDWQDQAEGDDLAGPCMCKNELHC